MTKMNLANFTKRVLETALKVEANTTSSYILYQPIAPVKIKKFALKGKNKFLVVVNYI